MFLLIVIHVFNRIIISKYYRSAARHNASIDHIAIVRSQPVIDYLIIGDSTGLHSFKPRLISANTFSICISGASLLDTYRTLIKFDLSKVKKGIILSNSFNSYQHELGDFWQRYVLTNTYSNKELIEIYNEGKENNIFPANQFSPIEYYLTIVFTKLYLNKYGLEALSEYLKNLEWGRNYYKGYAALINSENPYLGMAYNASYRFPDKIFYKPYNDFYSKPFQISDTDQYYFNKIYQLTSQAKLKLIMVLPPVADKATNRNISIFKKSFESYFYDYASKHPNYFYVPINIELPLLEFDDFNHLNSPAAEKVTRILIDLLKKIN